MENTDIKYFDIEELGIWPITSIDLAVHEGDQILSHHLRRERNSQIVKLAKDHFKRKNNGRIFCEICEFDFSKTYGALGAGFIEAHHKTPIAKMNTTDVTTIDDFVMVCSNCHSMLHKGERWISCDELKQLLNKPY
ncbi:MAG: HNH endonuclease [Ruminiclostridium sp.]|nr:HNH endonuclease [Ruminiclostridium sp.]